jgi:hypothetical protein
MNRITKSDINDADIIDSYELNSDGYSDNSIYFSTTVVSTTSSTKTVVVNLASDGGGLLYSYDHPLQSGDIVWLFGTTGADGYYTVDNIINDTAFTVKENISSSINGNVQFRYVSGASKIGVNSKDLHYSQSNTVQKVFEDLDGYIAPKPVEIGQFLYAADASNLKFVPAKPIINDDGLILVNDDDIIIVMI